MSFKVGVVDTGQLRVHRGEGDPKEGVGVVRVDTVSKSYAVDVNKGIGDAIRNGTPYLRVDKFETEGAGVKQASQLTGHVWGHPDREDGSPLLTASIVNFQLENGEHLETSLGKRLRENDDNGPSAFSGIGDFVRNENLS